MVQETLKIKMEKRCPSCKKIKLLSEFQKNITRKDGHQSHCKECFRERYGRDTPEKRRKNHIESVYKIKYGDYLQIYADQNGQCAICKKQIKAIGNLDIKNGAHVDHDHHSNKIRGLLCHSCNAGIGYFEENIEVMNLAINYLEYFKHKGK